MVVDWDDTMIYSEFIYSTYYITNKIVMKFNRNWGILLALAILKLLDNASVVVIIEVWQEDENCQESIRKRAEDKLLPEEQSSDKSD